MDLSSLESIGVVLLGEKKVLVLLCSQEQDGDVSYGGFGGRLGYYCMRVVLYLLCY